MAKCVRCKIQVDDSLTHCPVCGRYVHAVDSTKIETLYPTPDYKHIEKQSSKGMHSMFAFPLILALLITLFIDLALIANELGTTFLMTFIIFYLWIFIYKTIFNRQGIGYIMLWQFFGLSIGMIMLAFVGEGTLDTWPLQYAVPLMISFMNLLFFIIATTRQKTDVMLFQMFITALLGLVQFSLIFWLINPDIMVPSLIAGLTSLFSIGALLTYLRKKFFDYMHRWLHI
jgi:hypothetical protein